MNFTNQKVYDYLREVLGSNVDGLYLSRQSYDNGDKNEIFSNSNFKNENIVPYETKNCKIYNGISRVTIVPNDEDFVIKIAFTGIYDYSEEIINGEIKQYFELVQGTDEELSPFEEEYSVYNSLYTDSKPAFLQNIWVFDYCGLGIYLQPKVTSIYKPEKSILTAEQKEELLNVSKSYSNNCQDKEISDGFIYDIIKFYGEDIAKKILADCIYISDLHDQNYGYLENGQPVFFDYGGFDPDFYN